MFIYSGYWRTWSRKLVSDHPLGYTVEVNLTPVNSWKEEVEPIRIRAHFTAFDKYRDKLVGNLPPEILEKMRTKLDDSLIERLLTEDFGSRIDWEKYSKVNNGGANFELIKK